MGQNVYTNAGGSFCACGGGEEQAGGKAEGTCVVRWRRTAKKILSVGKILLLDLNFFFQIFLNLWSKMVRFLFVDTGYYFFIGLGKKVHVEVVNLGKLKSSKSESWMPPYSSMLSYIDIQIDTIGYGFEFARFW